MGGPLDASAIVLAGGRSSRFNSDKMAVELDGMPLLHHAVRAVAAACRQVIVVGAASGLPVPLPAQLTAGLLVILDRESFAGPLVAMARAAPLATFERLLLVAGDMPGLQRAVLDRVLGWPPEQEGACLVFDAWPQPFPLGLDRGVAAARTDELVAAGERSLRALMRSLRLEPIPEGQWRLLDPEGRSLRDVDRPEDL